MKPCLHPIEQILPIADAKQCQKCGQWVSPEGVIASQSIKELLDALQGIVGMCNLPEVRQAMMKHEQAYYHSVMNMANQVLYKYD